MSAPRNLTNLDFIRSVAVVLVAFSHLMLYTGHGGVVGWSGMTGVMVFFVHTSLVLMWSMERDGQVERFYIRRVFRIYPLWLVVLLITLAVRLPMAPKFAPAFRFYFPGAKELIGNVLLIGNLGPGMTLVGASWTLPIEVQMYLVLPLLFFFVRSTRLLWPLLLIDALVVAVDRQLPAGMGATLLTCVPYFVPGVMAYVLSARTKLRVLPGWLFAVLFLCMVSFDRTFGNLHRSWMFCLTLGLGLPMFRDMTATPVRVVSHYVARYSYGIYLSHIMAIEVAVHALRNYGMVVRVGAFAVLFCGLPVIFYHLVEEPMMRVGSRVAKRVGRGKAPNFSEREAQLEPVP